MPRRPQRWKALESCQDRRCHIRGTAWTALTRKPLRGKLALGYGAGVRCAVGVYAEMRDNMQRFIITFTALFLFSVPSGAEEPRGEELCNVMGLISTLFGKDGPLIRCREGDIAHFQVDKTLVSPASVAARYCDFSFQILTDTLPNSPTIHLVCRYKWKWAKEVEMTKHPDARQ